MLGVGLVGTAPSKPVAPTLIYDASCSFCRRWVARLKRLDGQDAVRLIPLDAPTATAISGQPRDRLEQAAHFVRLDGSVFAGAAAAREVARHLRGGWLLRALLGLPGSMALAERLYRRVARHWGPVN